MHCTPIQTPKTPKTSKVVTVSPKRTPKSILKKSKKSLFETQDSEMRDAKRIKTEMPSLQGSDFEEKRDDDLINLNGSRNDNLELEDLPDVSVANTNASETESLWLTNQGLKLSDKEAILNDGTLNSQIIEAVSNNVRAAAPRKGTKIYSERKSVACTASSGYEPDSK